MTRFRSGNHDGQTPAHQARSVLFILLPQRLTDGLQDPAITFTISAGKSTLIITPALLLNVVTKSPWLVLTATT